MLRNTKNNLVYFRFPYEFVPEEISNKYDPLLKAYQTPFKSTVEYLNSLITNITLPSISVDNIQQTHARATRNFRGGLDIYRGISKEFTIDMRLTEGYLSYFMLYDILIWWNDSVDATDRYINDFELVTLDLQGREVATIKYKEILYNSITELTLAYSDVNAQFNTFSIGFNSNIVDISPKL